MKNINLKQFLSELELMHTNGLQLQALIMILIGIEYVGSFFDNEPFEKAGLSEKRFNTALKKLFTKEIYQQRNYLYRTLRAQLIHGLSLKEVEKKQYQQLYDAFSHSISSFLEKKDTFKIASFKLKRLDF